jgi:3-hexulose-6-phosphate synthase
MKLQIALDEFDVQEAVSIVEEAHNSIDIIEAGTPFIINYGLSTVTTLRAHFPKKEILADTKIVDGGYAEASATFEAGADYCTVLGLADDFTIKGVVKAGRDYGKKAVVDLICVDNLEERCQKVVDLGIDMLAIHTAVDQQAQGRTPLGDLKRIMALDLDVEVEVAGGINKQNVSEYVKLGPSVVVVGGGIAHVEDKASAAKEIKKQLG